jgi:hypothetical protein
MSKRQNRNEITEFKEYLKSINFMNDFKKDSTIRNFTDARIKMFVKKYQINSIDIYNCKPYPRPYAHFTECRNMLILRNTPIPFIQANHALIFDYSEDGLKLKDGIPNKHKIAEGIFVF